MANFGVGPAGAVQQVAAWWRVCAPAVVTYSVLMLELQHIDLDEIATALEDQNTCDRADLINARTGEISLCAGSGISCTSTIRTCCRRGTPSMTLGRCAGR
jgi:hypothetical protein